MPRCILFDQTDIFGHRIGGAETFLKGIVRYAPPDVDLTVIGTTADVGARPVGRPMRVTFRGREIDYLAVVAEHDENQKSRVPLSLRYTMALRRAPIERRGAALLFNRIEQSLAFRGNRCAKYVVVHNDVVSQIMSGNASESIWSRMPLAYRWMERIAVRDLDHLYTVSTASLDYFRRTYPRRADRFSFLPTWLDPEIFGPSARPKAELRATAVPEVPPALRDGRWLLFVGRLQEQKAPIRLIDVFARCLAEDPRAVLLIVGDGNLRDRVFAHAAERGLMQRIVHVPFLPQSRLVDVYRAADVLVLVSHYEGMPISVLEALGCGLPVVSTRVGEVPRVVRTGRSGEVVDSTDEAVIASAVLGVAGSPDRYCAQHCIDSVQDYMPARILQPLFATMIEACRRHAGT
jgi:glycosyltransferase involved in cell wall biosynthesis